MRAYIITSSGNSCMDELLFSVDFVTLCVTVARLRENVYSYHRDIEEDCGSAIPKHFCLELTLLRRIASP